MKIVIVGAGDIGSHLAISLARSSHQVTVVEKNESLIENLQESLDANIVTSDGTSIQALAQAEVGDCDLFLALTRSKTTNLLSSSLAKSLGAKTVLTRVNAQVLSEEWLFDFRKHFHLDYLFSAESVTAFEIARHIHFSNLLEVRQLGRGIMEWHELSVRKESLALGKALKSLSGYQPKHVQVIAIFRKENLIIAPEENLVLEEGDRVFLCGYTPQTRKLSNQFKTEEEKKKVLNVVIFGGSEYGLSLARVLQGWNYHVRIFEKNKKICEEIADKLGETTVVQMDMAYLENLQEEELGSADFFIATSERDEDNVMMCFQAKSLGVPSCLTLIRRSDYVSSVSKGEKGIGIDATVSPREAILKEVNRFVFSNRYHLICTTKAGLVLGIPVRHATIAVGRMVSEIEWPKGVVLLGHLKSANLQFPNPEETLDAGDYLYILVPKESEKSLLKLFL